jgi:hypothetical protein
MDLNSILYYCILDILHVVLKLVFFNTFISVDYVEI